MVADESVWYRFLRKIRFGCVGPMETDCWLWTGTALNGYGQFRWGKMRKAHRVAYELLVGPIPDGKELDHLCRVTRCVNPLHLEPVSRRENAMRGVGSKTHCSQGHEFTPENTYMAHRPNREPHRQCRTCKRELMRESRRAMKRE